MNIWTERLERGHLSMLERWIGRADSALTANDLPAEAGALRDWFENAQAEPGRLDCLALVYETPVGVTGLLPCAGREGTAALYLLLGERNYNPLRTATYVSLRMLNRAFGELGLTRVETRVGAENGWFLDALERMGFSCGEEREDTICLAVEKARFLDRKYLF